VSPVKYEVGFYIPDDDILHSHRSDDLKSYDTPFLWSRQVTNASSQREVSPHKSARVEVTSHGQLEDSL
jgi:hypothetical protein